MSEKDNVLKKTEEAKFDIGSLPDRLISPEEYESVLSTTEEHTRKMKELVNDSSQRLPPVYTYGIMN